MSDNLDKKSGKALDPDIGASDAVDSGKKAKALVLLSGGLDSTVSLAFSIRLYKPVKVLFFDYGQSALSREKAAASGIAAHYGIGFEMIGLPWLAGLSSSKLIVGGGKDIPDFPDSGKAVNEKAASNAVWVENRNGIFINIGSAFASSLSCQVIITGYNVEEAAAFPDNSSAFIKAVNKALEFSTLSPVRVESPTVSMKKNEIVRHGLDLDIPWELVWSCYRGGNVMCGVCESCTRFKRALSGTPAEKRVLFSRRD